MKIWQKQNYGSEIEMAIHLLECALVEFRKLQPADVVERAKLDALRRDINELIADEDVAEDDGTCSPCGGSGGGDYTGIYCPSCNGRGYHKQQVEAFE